MVFLRWRTTAVDKSCSKLGETLWVLEKFAKSRKPWLSGVASDQVMVSRRRKVGAFDAKKTRWGELYFRREKVGDWVRMWNKCAPPKKKGAHSEKRAPLASLPWRLNLLFFFSRQVGSTWNLIQMNTFCFSQNYWVGDQNQEQSRKDLANFSIEHK